MSVPDATIKVILVGDSGVGKSSLLKSYLGDPFESVYASTVGLDFDIKQLLVDGNRVALQCWDTAGQERFRSITSSYYRGCDAVLLCYSVDDIAHFRSLDIFYADIRAFSSPDVQIVLVGTKADCGDKRQVDAAIAQEWASLRNMRYIETSARTGHNVEQAFTDLAVSVLANMAKNPQQQQQQQQQQGRGNVALSTDGKQDSSGCC